MKSPQYPPLSPRFPRLSHGGDYYPEQWSEPTWREDDALMKLAHTNSVTLGVFSWVSLEPSEGKYRFDWLDAAFDIQEKSGRSVVLATPSAAIPAWLAKKYPEVLRVGADGVRVRQRDRVNTCWTSPIMREKSQSIARKLAERYGKRPSLALWHLSNEYGGECQCALCQEAFRQWLRKRYGGDLDKLNIAYWSRFWSHWYTEWDEIEIPGNPHGENAMVGQVLDWRRFVSDQIVDFMRNEAASLRELTPNVPLTTNMMGVYDGIDYWKMARELDLVSWDSYPFFQGRPTELGSWSYVAMSHDIYRSMKGGKPFLLMECTPSSSNWYPVMGLKRPNQHVLEGLQAVSQGSEGVNYFQWRQSRGGMEQFHGAVVSHIDSTEARVFKDVASLGAKLEKLSGVVGASVSSDVALIFDWENHWAVQGVYAPRRPGDRDYPGQCLHHYEALWKQSIAVDVIDSEVDLGKYKLVVAPMLLMLKPGVAERIGAFVEAGGTFVTTYWSLLVDESAKAFQGGYPAPLRKVLGIWSEDTDALYDDVTVPIQAKQGNHMGLSGRYEGKYLCEMIHSESAEALAIFDGEFYAGEPAATRNSYGSGDAYYLATQFDGKFLRAFFGSLVAKLGLERAWTGDLPEGVVARRRSSAEADFVFLQNFTCAPVSVRVFEDGLRDAFTDASVKGSLELESFGSRVFVQKRKQP